MYLADTNKRKVNIDRLNKQPIVEAVVISSNIYDYLLETMVVQVAAEPASRRCQEVAQQQCNWPVFANNSHL